MVTMVTFWTLFLFVSIVHCTMYSLHMKTPSIKSQLSRQKVTRVELKVMSSLEDMNYNQDWILWIEFNDTMKTSGWSQLEIHTNADCPDSTQAYFAGFVEGYLTSNMIQDHYHNLLDNYCDKEEQYCDKVTKYLDRNLNFVTKQSQSLRSKDPYWHQVALMLEQLSGLEEGYKMSLSHSSSSKDANSIVIETLGPRILESKVLIKQGSLLWLNMITELFDLEYVYNRTSITNADDDGYCSALIKLLPEKNELFVAHNTWISYNHMLRFLKKYDFHYHETKSEDNNQDNNQANNQESQTSQKIRTRPIYAASDSFTSNYSPTKSSPGNTNYSPTKSSPGANYSPGINSSPVVTNCEISFSSYPGIIFSIDDFYILSSGLVVTETSIQNSNPDLNKFVDQPDSVVLEFIRVMISNRLSNSGKSWTGNFGQYNSGTYNNQFLIIDYNQFKKWTHHKSRLDAKDILWIIEQMPGMIESADITGKLISDKYFASYNRAYFDKIFKASGAQNLINRWGDYYSYSNTPRALIFERDHHLVTDLSNMYLLMRYNDFKHDPLSRCHQCSPPFTAIAAISARNDLNDPNGVYPVPPFAFRGSGAIDTKVTSVAMVQNLSFVAVSSPSYENQPIFSWSTTHETISNNLRHSGHPDTFNFPPQLVKWSPETTLPINL